MLDGGGEVLYEGVFPQIAFALGKGGNELLHPIIGQVSELVAVELLTALGGVAGGGLVGFLGDRQVGEVLAEPHDQLVFVAFGVVHHLGELCGDGKGLGDNIKLKLFHGILPFLSVWGWIKLHPWSARLRLPQP